MVARELAYNIVVGAVRSSGVDQAFGGVNRRITQTRMELADTLEFQKSLNAAITEARRAGENYQPLQEELRTTNARVDELNQSIQEQQAQIKENDERAQRWGRRMRWVAAGAAALSAALIALVQIQGEYSRSLVNAAEITGQSAEELERMDQAARRLTGQSLSPDAWVGVLDSMRQLQHQFRLGTDLSEDQLIAFQRLRLNPYQTAAFGAREWYEALLGVAPEHRAITAAAVPGLSAIYTALRPALEQNQSWNEVLAETVALSDETHQRYADTQRRLGDIARGFRNAGTEASAAFLPALEGILEIIVPVVRGFAMFAEQNPHVVRALAAIGIGLGAVTTALWLANVAATFFAAVSGVGLPLIAGAAIAAGAVAAAGGVAFALGGGFGGGASAAEQQEAAQAEAESRQRSNDNANADKVVGAIGAAQLRNEAVFERSRQELDPILRGIECLENAHADEPGMGETGQTFATNAPITQRHLEPFASVLTPEERRMLEEGVNRIERTVPTSNVGEQLQFFAGDRVIPFAPQMDDHAYRERLRERLTGRQTTPITLQSLARPTPITLQSLARPTPAAAPAADQTFFGSLVNQFERVLGPAALTPSVSPPTGVSPPSNERALASELDSFLSGLSGIGHGFRDAFVGQPQMQQVAPAPVSTGDVNVTNNFYDTPDPAGEIVRETEVAIGRVNTRR